MPAALQSPSFRGLRLAGDDDGAAASVFERVFGAPAMRAESSGGPRFLFDDQWIEMRAAHDAAVDLRCDDLDAQRTHLQRLGIEALDGSALGCTPCLRLDAMDTGACTVDLREHSLVNDRPSGDCIARLCGLELAVRAPERVALHWTQLFHAQPCRDADGVPSLKLGPFSLRFASAPDGRTGVTALDFVTTAFDALVRNASSQGFNVQGEARHAAFMALGIAFRLRPDT
ncbi:hypothetical protein QTH90_16365 [Variovorax sp. J2P1-59]|uniref:hypothetical protein n=1 Tax=Variovorax flavidus TaxID=3053501 RepID=UPI002575C8BE|nr:hypothetical protein [Variovorax sp. J2P1-59]MDM0075980.1 hypothetical protein [Variovorax sp. J2P1-59]